MSGCITPDRSNAFDPANAPKLELRILDVTQPDGHCPESTGVTGSIGTLVQSATRTRCLAIDALFADPQGDDIEIYRFSRQVVGTTGDDLAFEEFAEGPSSVALIGTSYLLQLTPGQPFELRARAKDESGDIGFRSTSLVLVNTPPIAVAPPSRTLPYGGFPWASGVAMEVVWDPSASKDPDGDSLTYCFDFPATADLPAENDVCGAANDPRFARRLAPNAFGRTVAYLTVVDSNGAESAEVPAPMYVGTPNLWAVPTQAPGTLQRIDTERVTLGIGNGVRIATASGSRVAISYHSSFSPAFVALLDWPSLAPIGPLLPPSNIGPDGGFGVGLAFDPDEDVLWGVGPSTASGPMQVKTWTTTGNVLGSESTRGTFEDTGSLAPGLRIDIASDSSAWIARKGGAGGFVRVAAASGAPLLTPAVAGRVVTGLAPRPGTGEVWIMETRDFVTGTGLEGTRIQRYSADGTFQEERDVDAALAIDIRWANGDSFWTYVPGAGLLLLDAEVFFDGADRPLATRQSFPEVQGVARLFVDDATGDCWATTGGDTAYRATVDGKLDTMRVLDGIEPATIDAAGALWFAASTTLGRGLAVQEDASIGEASIHSLGRGGVDRTTGWIWVPTLAPTALVQFGERGQLLRSIDQFVVGGIPRPVPILYPFRLSADGTTAWGVERGNLSGSGAVLGLWRIDLDEATSSSVVAEMIAGSEASDWLQGTAVGLQGVMEPSPPGISPPYLWVYNRTTGGVHQVAEDGIVSAALFTVPAAERTLNLLNLPMASVSLATGKLCLATRDEATANGGIHTRRIASGGGAPEVFGTLTPSSVGQFIDAVASSGDVCFVQYGAAGISPITNVASFQTVAGPNPTTYQRFGIQASTLAALSPNEIWLIGGGQRVRATLSGGFWSDAAYPTTASHALVSPEGMSK